MNHAVAVRISALGNHFKRTIDPYQWVLPTAQLELVYLEGFYVATREFSGRDWLIVDQEK